VQPSIFNKQVPLTGRDELFLMNMFTDSQLVVSPAVTQLLDRLDANPELADVLSETEQSALEDLREHGFVVESRDAEWRAVDRFFRDVREDPSELRVTVLTTLQCNFACDYCFQGDHGDYNATAEKMSAQTANRLCDWIELRLDELGSKQFGLTFFGGEPLLNLPVMYAMAERLWRATQERGVDMRINVITNGLLLTPDVVDRLEPFGLHSIKITLDGDREAHDHMRPLRGGQGTFDRIIANIRQVAHRCNIAIGGNFVEDTVDSYPALLDFLKAQDFADKLVKVSFKPVIREQPATATATPGLIPLTPVGLDGSTLGGTCMTSAGSGAGSVCDSCNLLESKMSELREETKKRGFETLDGVHMGPCDIHRRHSNTVGPDGSIYACPGFTGERTSAIGHISEALEESHRRSAADFESLAAWKSCGDCAFIPVCAGGCSVASQSEQGDKHKPTCHKDSMEAALVTFAHDAAGQMM
jgi:uncharacterized protein